MTGPSHNSLTALQCQKADYLRTRHALIAQYPDLDDETLFDTLEGISDLNLILAEVVRSALEDQALGVALSTRISDMRLRCTRLERRVEIKRALVLDTMLATGHSRLTEPDFTVSIRSGQQALQVLEERAIPADFWKPQASKIDRQSLLAALKSGEVISGVALASEKKQLSVRTK